MIEDNNIKQRIIEIASEMLITGGYKTMRVDDIAAKLSISKKTIYDYFSSKSEIMKSVIIDKRTQFRSQLQQIINRLAEDKEFHFFTELKNIILLIKQQVSFFSDKMLFDVKLYLPEFFSECEDFDEYSRQQFIKIFEIGIGNGYFDPSINPDIFFLIHKSVVRDILTPEVMLSLPYSVDDLLNNIFKILYKGVLTTKAQKQYTEFFEKQ